MKKVISLLLLMLIVMAVWGLRPIQAASTTFSVEDVIGNIGSEIEVTVSLNEAIDFVSGNFTLEYDNTKLEYVDYTNGKILDDSAMNVVKNDDTQGIIAIGYVSDPTIEIKTKEAGSLITIKFKVIATTESQTYVKFNCTSLTNEDGEEVANTVKNGTVSISKMSAYISSASEETETITKDSSNDNTPSAATTKLPQTGEKTNYLVFLGIVIVAIISYKKYKEYKEI